MKILLDTHMIIWFLAEDTRITQRAQNLIRDPENTVFFSVVSTWEVLLKRRQSPNQFTLTIDDFLSYCHTVGFSPLLLNNHHIVTASMIKKPDNTPRHNDPFDMLLLAQAKTENLMFLTHDKKHCFI